MVHDLRRRLALFPRLPLASYPTPLAFLPRLSDEVGRPVYIKRDDDIGPGLGGNKTRKLEYLLAEAQESGAHKVVTFGGLQSNHARLTAAAAVLRFDVDAWAEISPGRGRLAAFVRPKDLPADGDGTLA